MSLKVVRKFPNDSKSDFFQATHPFESIRPIVGLHVELNASVCITYIKLFGKLIQQKASLLFAFHF